MIPRYSRPDMVAIWSPETRFRIWFEIEAHAADAMAKLGLIPKTAAKKIWDKGGKATFDIDRIDEIGDSSVPFGCAVVTPFLETSPGNDDVSEGIIGHRWVGQSTTQSNFHALFQPIDHPSILPRTHPRRS